MKLVYTQHALTALAERGLEAAWVEATLAQPEWTATDPQGSNILRYYRAVPERGGRMMRVVAVESAEERRILTVFLDRRAKRPT